MTSTPTQAESELPAPRKSFFHVLDPLDLTVEAIYTVLIVMTFTLAVHVFDEENALGHILNQTLLSGLFLATFGCAVAWGMIDGVMYILTSLGGRSQQNRMIRTIREAPSREEGIRIVGQSLEDGLPIELDDEARANIERLVYQEVANKEPSRVRIEREDLQGGLAVALIAILFALPVVLPLLLVSFDPFWAVRLSNLVAFVMLFYLGYRWARYAGGVPWTTGVLLLGVGVVMVLIAIPLGG